MFKFDIQQEVKVQVYNKVLGGTIVMRTLQEDKNRSSIVYTVNFPQGIGCGTGTVEVSEDCLVETQLLELDYD